jgi:hypothetical protein
VITQIGQSVSTFVPAGLKPTKRRTTTSKKVGSATPLSEAEIGLIRSSEPPAVF